MPVQNPKLMCVKAAVSVSEMARAVGLSRSRFYDYVRNGVFPQPMYSLINRRPFFTAEQQQEILTTRQTGIGGNGEYVLFYERRPGEAKGSDPLRRGEQVPQVTGLLTGLKSLGLNEVTQAQIDEAMATVFPAGVQGVDDSTVLRLVYRHLRRRNAA